MGLQVKCDDFLYKTMTYRIFSKKLMVIKINDLQAHLNV